MDFVEEMSTLHKRFIVKCSYPKEGRVAAGEGLKVTCGEG
jgi:hypothetical protein